MIGLIKGLIYMIFALLVAQFVNFIYGLVIFYLKKKKNVNSDVNSDISLNMLQCKKCKLYVSKSDAYIVNGEIFCKKEHSE
jgi:hypothetical protein